MLLDNELLGEEPGLGTTEYTSGINKSLTVTGAESSTTKSKPNDDFYIDRFREQLSGRTKSWSTRSEKHTLLYLSSLGPFCYGLLLQRVITKVKRRLGSFQKKIVRNLNGVKTLKEMWYNPLTNEAEDIDEYEEEIKSDPELSEDQERPFQNLNIHSVDKSFVKKFNDSYNSAFSSQNLKTPCYLERYEGKMIVLTQ